MTIMLPTFCLLASTLVAAEQELPPPSPQGNQLLNLTGVPVAERTRIQPDFWPAQPGEAAVCLWKDDKLAAISFTIDDNCAPNVDWWLEAAGTRGIPLTWFVVTGGVDGSNKGFNGTWELWRRVHAAGHAIESHTVTHLSGARGDNLAGWQERGGIAWEYEESRKHIEANIPGKTVRFLAYPGGGESHRNDASVATRTYLAARGTKGMPNGPQGLNYLSINAMSKSNFGGTKADWSNVNNILDKQLYGGRHYGGWAVLIFHMVKKPYTDTLAKLDFAAEHRERLWAGRFGDVASYGQQRETSTLTVTEQTDQRIVLLLTDRMDDSHYDQPLTVKVHLPSTWTAIATQQAGKPVPHRLVEHDGATYALVDIVPDRGEAVVKSAP